MKTKLLFTILATTMLIPLTLTSAEIIPVWNRTIEGKVQDMEFLKGQNEILMLVGEGPNGQIQRRNPENGELIHSFPQFMSSFAKFAITPDSLRFIHLNGIDCSLRNLEDKYSITSTFSLAEKQEDSLIVYFTSIAIDPIRPNAYVTTYGWNKNTNQYAPRGKVIVYNYETGEHIKDLTEYGEDEYPAIEVSPDGKYLATLNDNKSYLKVWNLETMELIINEPLFDEKSKDRCGAEDIYFSKLDDNVIYISGNFTKRINSKDIGDGTFKYFINDKTRELLLPDAIYASGNLIFLNQETIILNTTSQRIGILNLLTDILELYGYPPKNVYSENVIYNETMNYFIGASGNELSKFLYDRQTNIETVIEEEIIISPNPTNSFVNLELKCNEPKVSYQINEVQGKLLFQNTSPNQVGNFLQLDFTPYPAGVYFITINCGNELNSYKVVRE